MNMLRSIREKKGLTLGQLAARASIASRVLAEYEEGRQPIPLPHAKLLAKALWVRIEELMPPGGSGTPPPAQTPAPAPPATTPRPEYRPPVAAATPPPDPPASHDNTAPAYTPPSAAPAPRPQPPQGGYGPGGPRPDYRPQSGQAGPPGQRPAGGGPGQGQPPRRGGEGRPPRPPRAAAPPPKPIGEGQIEELLRLGTRLELEQAQVEERTGKPLANLTRAEAKDWIKRFRDMLEETSPGGRVSFGQWPGTHEDREATYLGQQRDAGAILDFKLFNGERFTGKLMDFTPYTITIQSGNGEEIVLRKLAVVYYRHPLGADANGVSDSASVVAEPKAAAVAAPAPAKAKRSTKAAEAKQAAAAAAEHIQPLDTGLNSDRPGEPETPEKDHMDQDRGL